MQKINSYIVDSFTNDPFKGNPAGVCLLDNDLSAEKMLLIAQELGFSETAFVKNISNNKYSIRFFSPKMEIMLCGHATLASAKVLFNNNSKIDNITFINTQNLELNTSRINNLVQMQFPLYTTQKSTAPKAMLDALGIDETLDIEYNTDTETLLIAIKNCAILQNLQPDFNALIKSHNSIHGVVVTARSDNDNFDFESRFFWPWQGTNEDPATGSTHTFLTSYWGKKLRKTKMRALQCSERTGFMDVEIISANKLTITSDAQIIFTGILHM